MSLYKTPKVSVPYVDVSLSYLNTFVTNVMLPAAQLLMEGLSPLYFPEIGASFHALYKKYKMPI